MQPSPGAGKPAEVSRLLKVPRLVTAYYAETPEQIVDEAKAESRNEVNHY